MGNENLALPFKASPPSPTGWGWYQKPSDIIYFDDFNVLHTGHPSIRIEPHVEGVDGNRWRELNTAWIPVKVGDHIVFKVWVKTGHSTLGNDGQQVSGVLIIFDYYGASGRLWEHSSDNPRNDVDPTFQTQYDDPARYVPMNSDWTLQTLDTIVPSQVLDAKTGQLATEPVTGIIPCLVAGSYVVGSDHLQDEGQVWFADAELYINPEIVTPTPRPSGSAAVGGYVFGGYEATLPPALCRQLWKLRQKYIRPEVHRKIHPLV